MNDKLNWQRLQVSMNNFKINRLMSFTDIQNKMKLAVKNADQSVDTKSIVKLVNGLDHKDDFIQDNAHNQRSFKQLSKALNPLVGYAKVKDPITNKLNDLFKRASAKDPKAMKQFNLRAHKQNHLSAQQAMLQAMGMEVKAEKKNKK